MSSFFKSAIATIAKYNNKVVAHRMGEYGVKYEDMLASTPIVDLAISRLPWHLQEARDRRMIRAGEIVMRRKYLKPEQVDVDPLEFYLEKEIQLAEYEAAERRILDNY